MEITFLDFLMAIMRLAAMAKVAASPYIVAVAVAMVAAVPAFLLHGYCSPVQRNWVETTMIKVSAFMLILKVQGFEPTCMLYMLHNNMCSTVVALLATAEWYGYLHVCGAVRDFFILTKNCNCETEDDA